MPARTGTINTPTSVSSQNPPTPKVRVHFKNSINIKIGYLGQLEFSDNQATFTEVFGKKPTILAPNIDTSQDSTSTARILYSFGDKFKLDVFLHMWRKYYVGQDSIDNSLRVQDMCRHISEIKQEKINKMGYSWKIALIKCLINFCSYQSSFHIVRMHGLYNYVQHTSHPYISKWWIEWSPEDFKCHHLWI